MAGSMVCNCNNYGMIDYGIPLPPVSQDYRTSTYRGLRHIAPITQEFYGFKLDPYKGTHFEVKYDIYNTQNDVLHNYKSPTLGEKPNLPPRVDKNTYLKNFKEICYQRPPMPRTHYITEFADQYVLKNKEPTQDLPGIEERTTCHMSLTGKAEQPRLKTEESGIVKHLDIYMTTNRFGYPPYTPNEMKKAKQHALTYWETKTDPEIQMRLIKKPVNDELLFSRPLKDRILPKLVYRIPFKGKTSDYKGNFVSPTKSCLYTSMNKTDVIFKDALSKPNMSQTLAAPNMYCTEYCHIGRGRNVCAAIASKYEKKVKTHPMCGEHYY